MIRIGQYIGFIALVVLGIVIAAGPVIRLLELFGWAG